MFINICLDFIYLYAIYLFINALIYYINVYICL